MIWGFGENNSFQDGTYFVHHVLKDGIVKVAGSRLCEDNMELECHAAPTLIGLFVVALYKDVLLRVHCIAEWAMAV